MDRRKILAITALLAGSMVVSGCSGDGGKWKGPGGTDPGQDSPKGPVASATITAPTDGATDVSTAAEIAYTAKEATETTFELTDAAGTKVDGALRPDGSSWVAAKQLKYATKYTAKVTATGSDGKAAEKTVSFTTMAKPGSLARVSTQTGDNQVVGVGMPMIVNLGVDVPKDKRAEVQKRLFMTSDPPQEGVWNWFSAKELHFRPKEYWQPNTKLDLRAALGGVSFGGKWYGEKDVTVKASVGPKLIMEVDNATKKMTVTQDGQVLKVIPVSLGKASNPSASGNFIVMVKNPEEWFDSSTYGVPVDSADGYRTKVQWPQRITWSGQYIHAAPWSVADQGKRNVSHGCVNVSLELGKWLYDVTHLGDPVIVKNTEERVKYGDGWTDWELSFEEYAKGSAIPYVPGQAAAPGTGATPAPTTSGN